MFFGTQNTTYECTLRCIRPSSEQAQNHSDWGTTNGVIRDFPLEPSQRTTRKNADARMAPAPVAGRDSRADKLHKSCPAQQVMA